MKNNQPVTQVEQPFPKGQYIVSKTDLKGIITYANQAFIDLSGFSKAELKGQSHNIVRHPDMPAQAFADLWRTVQEGYPWQGVVKNRCKNGDFYWVKAFVVPVEKDDRVVGYMSVRKEPTREEIKSAEALYAQLNQTGESFATTPPWHQRVTIRERLIGVMAITVALLIGSAVIGISGLKSSNESLGTAYEQHMKPSVAIARMVERLGDNRSQVLLALQHSPDNRYHLQHDHPVSVHIDAALQNRKVIENLRKDYEASPKSPAEQALADAFFEARDRLSREGNSPARDALAAGDYDRAQTLLLNKINPLYKEVIAKGEALQNFMAQAGATAYADAQTRYDRILLLNVLGAIFAVVFVAIAGGLLVRSVSSKLQRIIRHFRHMSQGDLTDNIDIRGRDETGRALTELASMQISLKVMLDEIQAASRQIEEQSRKVEWQTANVVDQSEQQRDKASSVASATEELTQSVHSVSDSAASTATAADDAQVQVASAQESMGKSMEATGRVVAAVQQSSTTIQDLNKAIAKIGDITNVIREIADQTNLLALNAAIEAARAGEAGRGFAVVADEVRKLAERTATSTKDITSNVMEIQSVTDAAVASMSDAVQEVEAGIELIRESGTGLTRITETSSQVTVMARDIANAAAEQAQASTSVAENMARVMQLVDGNMDAAGNAKEAVDNLVQTAGYLNRIVARFKVTH